MRNRVLCYLLGACGAVNPSSRNRLCLLSDLAMDLLNETAEGVVVLLIISSCCIGSGGWCCCR